jgi:hypothetical protein
LRYEAPTTLQAAVALLAGATGTARLFAGGTGVMIAARALLERNPDPTETEARYWLAGNLCRCTGYDKIVRSVLAAAAEMKGA